MTEDNKKRMQSSLMASFLGYKSIWSDFYAVPLVRLTPRIIKLIALVMFRTSAKPSRIHWGVLDIGRVSARTSESVPMSKNVISNGIFFGKG